jgi:hypothetical protein
MAALIGIAAMAITTMTSLVLARQRSPENEPAVASVKSPRLIGSHSAGKMRYYAYRLTGWCR